MPAVRARLEALRLPIRLRARTVQVIAEKRCLDILAELARRLLAERNHADLVALRFARPAAVIPGAGYDKIVMAGTVLTGMAEYLPRPPGIFLVPITRDVQDRHMRAMQCVNPVFRVPVIVMVRVIDQIVPERRRPVEIFGVDIRNGTEIEIPLICVM